LIIVAKTTMMYGDRKERNTMKPTGQSRLYFAYGLNMNETQLRLKCSQPRAISIARLPGYRLGFYEHSVVWDGAMETIVPAPRAEVWGVLYQMEAWDWEQLDRHEDARLDGTGAYFHYPVEVMDEQGSVMEATVYLKSRWGTAAPPGKEYLEVMLQGAEAQGLPEDYIAYLRNIATKPASYPVPRRPSVTKTICGGGCSGCSV
jgi:gamma-glutamylcyclotransferase (GGCT)/AIG2-like uncharacterized protein YtfP